MKRDTLLAKRRAAAARQRMNERLQSGQSAQSVSQRLLNDIDAVADAYADDVERDQAQHDAEDEVRRFLKEGASASADDGVVEDELARLKRKMEG